MSRTRSSKIVVAAGTVVAVATLTTTSGSAAQAVDTSDRDADFVITVPALGPSGSLGSLKFCDTAAAGKPGFDGQGCRVTSVAADIDQRLHLFLQDPSDTYTLSAGPWDPTSQPGRCAVGETGFVFQAVGVSRGARVRAVHDNAPQDVNGQPYYTGHPGDRSETYYPGQGPETWTQSAQDANRSPGFTYCLDTT